MGKDRRSIWYEKYLREMSLLIDLVGEQLVALGRAFKMTEEERKDRTHCVVCEATGRSEPVREANDGFCGLCGPLHDGATGIRPYKEN